MRRVTIKDVAARAGVSKKTVSHVVNGLAGVAAATRERVELAVAELGYAPSPQARAFAAGHSSLVVLVHDGSDDAALVSMLAGLQEGLDINGPALAVYRHAGGSENLARYLAAHRPQGIVLAPPLSGKADLVAACSAAGCRSLAIDCESGTGAPLSLDLQQAAADATGWLWALGHRRLAFVAGPEDDPRGRATEAGFLDALAGLGARPGAEIVAEGDFSSASGEAAARLLLEVSPRPTAILAANDAMAAGAMQAVLAAGLEVPRDLSIMGLGDTPAAALLAPPLASVALPWREIGRLAAAQAVATPILMPPTLPGTLVPRGSVRPTVD